MASEAESTRWTLRLLAGPDGGLDILGVVPPHGREIQEAPPAELFLQLMDTLSEEIIALREEVLGWEIAQFVLVLRGGAVGPPPASKASIEAMRTAQRPAMEEEEECAVCLQGLWVKEEAEETNEGAGAVVKEMPCGHRFHGGCIERWLGLDVWAVHVFNGMTEREGGERRHQQYQQPQLQPEGEGQEQHQPMEEL